MLQLALFAHILIFILQIWNDCVFLWPHVTQRKEISDIKNINFQSIALNMETITCASKCTVLLTAASFTYT
jgi:hypothetical protein